MLNLLKYVFLTNKLLNQIDNKCLYNFILLKCINIEKNYILLKKN